MTSEPAQGVRAAVASPEADAQSVEAKRLFYDLMAVDPSTRHTLYLTMDQRDWDAVLRAAFDETGTPYGLWVDDPVGFVEHVLQETTWSKQREVLLAIPQAKRVAVPSAFGTGKTHISARAALWRSLVYPPGTSLTVTTATRFRQVARQLWPHIRQAVDKAGLPLDADTTQLHAFNKHGTRVPVAYGFSAPPHDEAAVQGIHAPRLFIVVDEAGGISRIIGKAMRGLLTGEDTRMLAIGNPPTDDEGSWFENMCNEDKVRVVRISAYDAPLLSGEKTKRCRACPEEMPAHRLGVHITDPEWVSDTIEDYGEDAPFVIAKVHARFPKGGPSRTIPSDWIDLAVEHPDLASEEGYVRLDRLTSDEERAPYWVRMGSQVNLGVDVAADGGDEFVMARLIGDHGHVVHHSSGAANTNSVDVANKVLTEIRRAQLIADAIHAEPIEGPTGVVANVHVKIDAIGVGWGVYGTLEAWRSEGIHNAEIVPVIVSEGTYREDTEHGAMVPVNKRAEMWLVGRQEMQPRADRGNRGNLRLVIDKATRAQLAAPTYGGTSTGKVAIETKAHMKGRGLSSPDRGEALLLAMYVPRLKPKPKGEFRVIV